jgi:hypothetical protein
MKLYIWKNNRTDSDFVDDDTYLVASRYVEALNEPDHSACMVILAENEEEAKKIAGDYVKGKPIEVGLDKSGVIVDATGEC